MSNIEPKRPGGMSRRRREQRAYSLVLATGGFSVLAVVLVVLAVLGVVASARRSSPRSSLRARATC
jgi:hypothetical protein